MLCLRIHDIVANIFEVQRQVENSDGRVQVQVLALDLEHHLVEWRAEKS